MRINHLPRHEMTHGMAIALMFLAIALLSFEQPVQAQGFNSGSTGADGALNLTTPGTIIFDPRSFNPPLDQDGDNVYHFTTISIASGVTVRLTAAKLNMKPVIWLASGAVQIDGTIELSGEAGYRAMNTVPADRRPAMPGPGGYQGGVGETPDSPAQAGAGPGGGGIVDSNNNHTSGSAGYSLRGDSSPGTSNGGAIYGNVYLVPLLGGSGGGGGTIEGAQPSGGGGGGAGGGALLIASSLSVTLGGRIAADGGSGGTGTITSNIGNGGSGSGGAIHLIAPELRGTGTLSAVGGSGGRSASPGRIRLEAFQQAFTGNASPVPRLGSPFNVFLPTTAPSVRVVSVNDVPVRSDPTGSFEIPDVTIDRGTASTVLIEARNVPLGTIVKLHLFPESAADQIVDSPPLQGTAELSTTTISVVIPTGLSRGFVRAVWR